MDIKISTLRSVLHDSKSFDEKSKEFINSIETKINNPMIITSLDDYNCDLKLIFIESGGSEMLFKKQIDKLKEPYYFLTSGDNNSLAATLEILTYLNTINKHGEIIHGSIDYIGQRIKQLAAYKDKILENKRYGVIGKPSDWLIASIPNYSDIENKYGAKIIDISLDELIDGYHNYKNDLKVDSRGFNANEVENATKVYEVLKGIVNKYKLDGFTIRCFDLLDKIHTTGCLALANFNSNGIIATCEGDIMAMLSMAIIKEVANTSSFQANPSRIDVTNNTILFAHCTIPLDMLNNYQYKTHFESGIGVAIKGELKTNEVTILRLSKDLKHYFVSRGFILENTNYPNLCRTQILVKLEKDVKELLTNPCGNHHIIFYGDYVDKINNLLN